MFHPLQSQIEMMHCGSWFSYSYEYTITAFLLARPSCRVHPSDGRSRHDFGEGNVGRVAKEM